MTIEIHNAAGKVVDKVEFDESVFGDKVKKRLLHQVVIALGSHKRQGTRNTRTRGELQGGGRKPFKQKHTGRARQGSVRSPLLRGGGTIFGPRAQDNVRKKVTKSMRRAALRSALLSKFKDGEIKVVDELDFDAPKTSRMVGVLNALDLGGGSCLVALGEASGTVWKSARNIPRVSVLPVSDINAYQVIKNARLLLTRDALDKLPEVVGR